MECNQLHPYLLKLKIVLALIITLSDKKGLKFVQTRRPKLAIEKEKANWIFRNDFEFERDT